MKTIWKVWARSKEEPLHVLGEVTKCQLDPAQMVARAGQFVLIDDVSLNFLDCTYLRCLS